MKKSLSIFLAVATMMATMAPQVLALEIRISSTGTIEFYQDGVLGENTTVDTSSGGSNESHQSEPNQGPGGSSNQEQHRSESTNAKPIETVRPDGIQELRIRTDGSQATVQLRKRLTNTTDQKKTTETTHSETFDSRRLQMQFPAALKPTETPKPETEIKKPETETRKPETEHPAESPTPEQKLQTFTDSTFELDRKKEEYLKTLEQDRAQRQQETLELRTQLKDNTQELELKSRNVKATVEQGAQFSVDPETNAVKIVTSSGNEHTLNHLPDQAIERMKAVGALGDQPTDQETQVSIETTPDGQVNYKAEGTVKKHVFGIFTRKIKTEVTVNDATGEVTVEPVKPKSLFEQFLNSVSS